MVTYVHGPRTCSTLHERLVKRLRHGGCMHVPPPGQAQAAIRGETARQPAAGVRAHRPTYAHAMHASGAGARAQNVTGVRPGRARGTETCTYVHWRHGACLAVTTVVHAAACMHGFRSRNEKNGKPSLVWKLSSARIRQRQACGRVCSRELRARCVDVQACERNEQITHAF